MTRPTHTDTQLAGSYAPAPQRGAPAPEVAARIQLPAARSARGLTEALGLVNKFAGDYVAQTAAKASDAGAADANLSKVDHERALKDRAYARGAYNVEAERQALAFMQEWSTRYATEIDKNAPAEAVARDFDNSARVALGHWLEDPVSKKIVAEKLAGFVDKTVGSHLAAQAKEREIAAVDTVGQSVRFDVENTGGTSFVTQFNKLAPMIGNSDAKRAVVNSVVAAAVAAGNPDAILRSLPEEIKLADGTTIPGPAKDAAFVSDIISGTAKAKAVQLERVEQANRERKAGIEVAWINDPLKFTQRDYDREIKATGVNQLFSSDELNSYLGRRIQALEDLKNLNAYQDSAAANPNVRLRILEGTPKADGKPYTNEDLQRLFNGRVNVAFGQAKAVEGEDEQQRLARVANEQSAREGYAYQPLANDLQLAPVSDHEKFDKLAQIYNGMSPVVRSMYVTDTDKRADYDRYLSLTGAGIKPKEAAQMLTDRNPAVVKASLEAHAKEWGKVQDKLRKIEMDDGGVFGGATKLEGVANSAQILQKIEQGARLRIERNMSPSDAVDSAKAEVLASHYFIKGPRDGTSLMLPLERGIARPDVEAAIPWLYKTVLKNVKLPEGTDAKKLRLTTIPTSSDNTTLVLIDQTTGLRVKGSPAFTLRSIVKSHKDFLSKEGYVKAQKQNVLVNHPLYEATVTPLTYEPTVVLRSSRDAAR